MAVLCDPDQFDAEWINRIKPYTQWIDIILVGGSLIAENKLDDVIGEIKTHLHLPVWIFPGSSLQISSQADGLLFLSLVSSRNPEYLIGQQVQAAPHIYAAGIEVLPCGYLLVDGGRVSTTAYITQSIPIPSDRVEVGIATALAAKYLGMQSIYLEAGSGAIHPIPSSFIDGVKRTVGLPLWVGGGIRQADQVYAAWKAGADVVVVGNVLESENPFFKDLQELKKTII